MYEFSTASSPQRYSIFVADDGQVTAVTISNDTRGKRYLRDEEEMNECFSRAARALVAECPKDFRKMRKLIVLDNRFWNLSEKVILQLINELNSMLD